MPLGLMSRCQTSSSKSCKGKLANRALHSSTNSSSQANIILLQLWPPSSKPLETTSFTETFSLMERLNNLLKRSFDTSPSNQESYQNKVWHSFHIFFYIFPRHHLTPLPSPFSILQISFHHNTTTVLYILPILTNILGDYLLI